MSTKSQASYINDLAVAKTKEFKEVKELLLSEGIVTESAETVTNATSLSEIVNALTDYQASRLIDALIAREIPNRSNKFSDKRITQAISGLDKIKATIADWSFKV